MPLSERKKAKGTQEEGIVYVSSFGMYAPSTDPIDAEKLHDYQDNVWVRGLAQKQKALIFTDKYLIEILDPKGVIDEKLGQHITNMCENLRLWPKMQLGYKDGIFIYGCAIFNQVWGYDGSEYVLQDLRYLPAYTFRNAGQTQQQTYSDILQGITLNAKEELEFWQTDNLDQIKQLNTDNIFWIKDPSVAKLTGESIILPLIPFIEMSKFSWSAIMQYMNRVGAPIIFIKITDPLTSAQRNGDLGDIDYGQEFLQKWGKDTSFLLRDNMEIIELNIKDVNNNLDVIDALHFILIDYMTPSSFISRAGGTSLGESDNSREEFFNKYIQGLHTWLEDQFERLLQTYLDKNGYKGYIANIHIPSPSIDRSEIQLKQADTGYKTRSLSVNELRERLGAEALDSDKLEELSESYAAVPLNLPTMSLGHASNVITAETLDPILLSELQKAIAQLAKDTRKALEFEE